VAGAVSTSIRCGPRTRRRSLTGTTR
jgi:hypothetical protein